MEWKSVSNVWFVDVNENLEKTPQQYFCKVTLMDLQTHKDIKLNIFGIEKKVVGDRYKELVNKDVVSKIDIQPFDKGFRINQVFMPEVSESKIK